MSSDDMNTQPTIETILERMDAFRKSVETAFDSFGNRFTKLENRFTKLENEFDGVKARVEALEKEFASFREKVDRELASFRDRMEDRLDLLDNMASSARIDVLSIKKNVRELHAQLKEHIPAMK